jgi:uncharacterized protein (TIGR02217 family)
MSYPVMSTSVPWSLVKSGFHKGPSFNSLVQPTAAGRGTSSLSLKPYATWLFNVDLNNVEGGESVQASVLQMFLGCFMACCGRGIFFLFTDPNDNTVTVTQSCLLNVTPGAATPMGQVGDGVSTLFQLARKIDQGVDILQQVSSVVVNVNGTPATCGILNGLVTFAAAPANGAVLTWSGSFQYLCQFTEDTMKDLARVSKNSGGFLWACNSIEFESQFV